MKSHFRIMTSQCIPRAGSNFIFVRVRRHGFTLVEVLVALVIIGTAFAASLRAISSLTKNSWDLRAAMMATWSAENRLSQIRLAQEWPPLGTRSFDCPQAELRLRCQETIVSTPNPSFRRVQVTVIDGSDENHKIITLSQIVPNAS
ncbi:MAG: type secretion system minor pseudopilin GspI [Pseudomonadota bacterium]